MNISVIVVCYNEENNIESCLTSLIKQSYDKNKFEIIVVDGGSQDNTQNVVNNFVKKYNNIKLVVENKRGTAAGRNKGVKSALFNYLAFIDADCEAPVDWLAVLVDNYTTIKQQDKSVIAVGGMNISKENSNLFTRAISIVLDSYIGSFNSIQGRQFKELTYVSSLSNLNVLYEKQKIIDIGLYDETLLSEAEDADLNYRLFYSGCKFVFIPSSFVWHKMRSTPLMWMKNMFRYGKGRARLLKRYPKMWSIPYILPILFILAMSSLLLAPFNKFFLLAILYFQVLFIFSIVQCFQKKTPFMILRVVLVYLIVHFGYAGGEIYGLVNPKVR